MAVNENLKFDPSNPFNEEAPKIVHFEKDESHYEYCRMQMHDIERVHRRTFIAIATRIWKMPPARAALDSFRTAKGVLNIAKHCTL